MTVSIKPAADEIKQPDRPRLRDVLGPGLITGASDDDPSGIATYSQAGAQFGYNLGWTLLFTYPLMCAIQMVSAQIGRVTGRGLAGNMRRHYPAPVLYLLIGLLIVANTINIGADLGAMAAALRLLIPGPTILYIAGFGIITVVLEVFMRYSRYASVLRWLTVSLFAYVATVFAVGVPWSVVASNLVLPHIELSGSYLTVVVAVFGTTISPYLFFWQAAEEVEDEKEDYIAQLIAARTGLSQADAEKRVSDVVEQAKTAKAQAEDAAKTAADAARKTGVYVALWAFISLLVGAFSASYMATVGGRLRDDLPMAG